MKHPDKTPKKTVTIAITQKEKDNLDQLVTESGKGASAIIGDFLTHFFDAMKKKICR